jgi:hypothetical protein
MGLIQWELDLLSEPRETCDLNCSICQKYSHIEKNWINVCKHG